MFCQNCGANIPDNSPICPKCGTKLATAIVDAGRELEKANAAAGDVVQAANEEAVKAAREFQLSVQENTSSDDKKDNSAENLPEKIEEAVQEEAAQLPDNVNNQIPKNDDPQVPAEVQQPVQNGGQPQKSNPDPAKAGFKISPALIVMCAAAMVIFVIALVFLLSKSARNGVKRLFMSDAGYFKSVEKNTLEDLIDDLGTAYDDVILELTDFYESEFTAKVDLKVKDEAREFLENTFRNVELDWISKANAEAEISMRDNKIRLEGNAEVNGEDLLDMDVIYDLTNSVLYGNIPLISKKYAQFDVSGQKDANKIAEVLETAKKFADALPSEKTLRNIAKKYLGIALDEIKEVKVYKDKKLKACGVEGEYYMMKAILDEYVIKDMYSAILTELQKDDEVAQILMKLEATGYFGDNLVDDFDNYIANGLEKIDTMSFKKYTLCIYVDGTGNVVAQELLDEDEEDGFTYKYVINDGNFGFEAYMLRNNKERTRLNISGTISGNDVSGRLNCYKKDIVKFSMDFEDVNIRKLIQGNPTGKIVYEAGYDKRATVEFDISVKSSKIELILSDSGKTLIDAEATIKKSSASKIKNPSDVVSIDSNSDLTDWIDSFNWKKLLDNAEDSKMPNVYYKKLEELSESASGLLKLFRLR